MQSFWSRRDFLFQSGGGVSGLALAYLLNQQGLLGAAPDGGACDAGSIERVRIAADNMGNRGSASGKAALLERIGNIADMPVQAALRDQTRGEQSHQQKSETQAQQFVLHDDGNCGNDRQNDEERNSAGEPPRSEARRTGVMPAG